MKKQRGNAAVIAIVIIVIVALLGLLGYIAYAKFFAPKTTSTESTKQTETKTETESVTKSDSGNDIYNTDTYSFEWPSKDGWVLTEEKYGETAEPTPTVRTSDYAQTGMGLDKGAEVAVYASGTDKTLAQSKQDFVDFPDGTDDNQVADVTVGGVPGFTYFSAYEGPRYHTIFIKDDISYDIILQYQADGTIAPYKASYDLIVSSFKFK